MAGLVSLVLVAVVVTIVSLSTGSNSPATATRVAKPLASPPVTTTQPISALKTSALTAVLPVSWQSIPACTVRAADGCDQFTWVTTRPATVPAALQLRATWTAAGFHVTTAGCTRESRTAHASCLVVAQNLTDPAHPLSVRASVKANAIGTSNVVITANGRPNG